VQLVAPTGWSVSPDRRPVELDGEGSERSYAFEVRPTGSPQPGSHAFRAVVSTRDGRRYEEGFDVIDYEHIERAALFAPAEATVSVVPVTIAEGLRVGYIMGPGDEGPEAIGQLGAEVALLGEDAVRSGAFAAYDVVVVGVRAYETRPELRSANGQLLDYARAGGTVIVQYQQSAFIDGGYAPYRVAQNRPADRVTDETADVRILEPEAPPFTTPNRIEAPDFDGWVQERGLYFLSEWDAAFTPLVEMNDPGEASNRGALVVASVGEGVYVYAALSFFRQWSWGVPGAYRLFANFLSLDGAAWRRYRMAATGGG
jgi:hypothetical protein